jgi:pyruvate,water dikinase
MDALEPYRARVVEVLEQTEMMAHVAAALDSLPETTVQWAVRSSATVEDNPRYSFAGQFFSSLSVPKGKALWKAVCQVWASNYGRAALLYCAQNAAPMPRMAVILQPMEPITAQDCSGVAFSHSPAPALPGVLIQASFGSGQVVVGGHGGDLFSVQGGEVRVQPMPPDHIRVTGEAGDTVPQPSPPGLALAEDQARELADRVLAVAERWGRPVNVEFVWRAGKKPTLVQVRSIAER